jgi:hypothetical protein
MKAMEDALNPLKKSSKLECHFREKLGRINQRLEIQPGRKKGDAQYETKFGLASKLAVGETTKLAEHCVFPAQNPHVRSLLRTTDRYAYILVVEALLITCSTWVAS